MKLLRSMLGEFVYFGVIAIGGIIIGMVLHMELYVDQRSGSVVEPSACPQDEMVKQIEAMSEPNAEWSIDAREAKDEDRLYLIGPVESCSVLNDSCCTHKVIVRRLLPK